MKRSELLHKLADMLEFQRQDLNNGSDYQDAETILSFLEYDVGMTPPEFNNYNPDQASRTFSRDSDWGKDNYGRSYLRQKDWESE